MWEERDVLLPWQQTHLYYSIPLHSLAATATCYQCQVTRDRIVQAHLQTRVQEAHFDWLTVKSVYFRVQQVQWRTPLFVTNGGWKPSIDWIKRCRTDIERQKGKWTDRRVRRCAGVGAGWGSLDLFFVWGLHKHDVAMIITHRNRAYTVLRTCCVGDWHNTDWLTHGGGI